ncbi:MAG: DUF4097 family beta strand repeat protein [Theionarchaea archaeon]|nr:MAG: hypothetical protein AYK18_01775 [Theionarchaea archaeon DG-70]MBU7010515.1 DUF4097 family beta strand repeat protein [Theionarchaea archaeon]
MSRHIPTFTVSAILLSIIFLLGCIDQSEKISVLPREESIEVFENNISVQEMSVDFQTYNGLIEVYFWDKSSYRIEAVKWARAATSEEARQKAEDLEIEFSEESEAESTTLLLNTEEKITAGVDVTAYLPRKSTTVMELSTFNGDLYVEEVAASDVSLTTANGDITGYITAHTIRVNTSNGKIRGFYQGNDVTLETINGRIDIECGYGEYDIKTTNGDIDITVYNDFTFNLRSTIGDIMVEADSVVYTLDEKDHKKGYTSEDAQVFVTASATAGSVIVVKK